MKPNVGDNYFTEMCSGSEAGSYLRLINFVSLNSRLASNNEEEEEEEGRPEPLASFFFFFVTLEPRVA